jgi:hypothetical protein
MTGENDGPIDVSRIKIEFPNAGEYSNDDPRFVEELRLLREELAIPGEIKKACIHETGHLAYFRLLGLSLNISPDEFRFVPPSVTYGLNENNQYEFDHFIAATSVPFNADSLDYTDENLAMLAKACFAGGLFVHEFVKKLLSQLETEYFS